MSIQSERVKTWRKRCKARIVSAFGGKCCVCGYNRCNSSLALHHLDPNEKDFGLGAIRANVKSWASIVVELRKCVLVCHNCHQEIHEGVSVVPSDAPRFDEQYSDYKAFEREEFNKSIILTPCLVCGTLKGPHLKYCSHVCSSRSKYKVDWDSIDLKALLESGKSIISIAESIGCSDAAVHKKLKKLGLK